MHLKHELNIHNEQSIVLNPGDKKLSRHIFSFQEQFLFIFFYFIFISLTENCVYISFYVFLKK